MSAPRPPVAPEWSEPPAPVLVAVAPGPRASDPERLHRYVFALQFCRGKEVLDVSPQAGEGSALLARLAARAVRADPPSVARPDEVSPSRGGPSGAAGYAFALPDASVDVVTSLVPAGDIEAIGMLVREARRVLRPGGVLVLSVAPAPAGPPAGDPATLLGEAFEHVVTGVQIVATASVVLPEHGAAAGLEWPSADAAPSGAGAARCRIAIASDAELPRIRWSALEAQGDGRNEASGLAAELEVARAETAALRANLERMVSSRSWVLTRPLREAAAAAQALRDGGAFSTFLWDCGKSLLAVLPAGERLRTLKRRRLGRWAPGRAGDFSTPDLDAPRVATALKRVLAGLAEGRAATDPCTHVFVVPFLHSGGADLAATRYVRFVSELRGPASCLVVLADAPDLDVPEWIPAGVATLRLDDHLVDASARERVDLLHGILRALEPRVVHGVNSGAAWSLFAHRGGDLSRRSRLFASMFALQLGRRGELVGYARDYFARAWPHLAGLLTDNARLARDLADRFQLDDEARRRIHVVYNPSRALDGAARQARRAERRPGEPLRVLWAGRLDAEKLPDVLQAVADRADFAEFDVFGSTVLDGGPPPLRPHARLRLRGPYRDLAQVQAEGGYDAFLFTSRWEGLPNVLLEAGALALPVVAPDVGGVPELVREDTGWLVQGPRNVDGFVAALDAIRRDPAGAAARADNLAALVRSRHGWAQFARALGSIPDYA